ncbi:MAG: hypothetical protein M1822_005178 [Bathelium mastoideum]|nr:MAG: hypothetical protein M1822_005178 [Bathelium mastoideum]
MSQNDPFSKMTYEEEHSIPLVNTKTGELLVRFPGESTRRVSRTKLRHLLSRGIDVQYGKKFERLDDQGGRITAFFEDGTTAEGNILIGCDSVQSKVRMCVLPPEKIKLEYLPFTNFNFTQRYTAEQANFIRSFWHPWVILGTHADQPLFALITVADIGEPDKPETCLFQLFFSKAGGVPPATNEKRLELFKEMGQQLCEPFKSAALWVKDDTYIHPDRLTHWPDPQKWDNHGGRVTLAGDAAHPMAPYRGQGLNNALEDAAYYVEAISNFRSSKQSLSEVIDAYDDEVRTRGKKEIAVSFGQAVAFHDWAKLEKSALAVHGTLKIKDNNP